MVLRQIETSDFMMLSQSVQSWYGFYNLEPTQQTSEVICSAAITLFNRGHQCHEDVTRILIARFPGAAFDRKSPLSPAVLH